MFQWLIATSQLAMVIAKVSMVKHMDFAVLQILVVAFTNPYNVKLR
jgi:hypothetical protein